MSQDPNIEQLTFALGGLEITVRRRPHEQESEVSSSTPSPGFLGSLAGPRAVETQPRAASPAWSVVSSPSVQPWSEAWTAALLAARIPADFEGLDLAPVERLSRRLRSSTSGWSPLARLGRALRAGVSARQVLDGHLGCVQSGPPIQLPNKVFCVLRGAPGVGSGWTESAHIYFAAVSGGPGRTFHPDSISHAFATITEAEAYFIGCRVAWPAEVVPGRLPNRN